MGLLRASGDSALRQESAAFCNCLYLAVAPDLAQSGIRISLLTRVVTQSYSHHLYLNSESGLQAGEPPNLVCRQPIFNCSASHVSALHIPLEQIAVFHQSTDGTMQSGLLVYAVH
jgi:hypothetical protein